MTDNYIATAKDFSKNKIKKVQDSLSGVDEAFQDRVCVYATGSYGRFEAGPRSDLDLFIVSYMGKKEKRGVEVDARALSGIDEIRLQSRLIDCLEANELPEFDGDGKYLSCHTIDDFVKYLGGPEDDARNTLTGRLLLLLESKPLLGTPVYERLIDHVIERYFRDHSDNPSSFVPAFLFNDILRMWRTFCVNYEHNRKVGVAETKIKNLKLKYSRMLTCYSGLLLLLHVYSENETVSQEDVKSMISRTPTERLIFVRDAIRDQGGESKDVVVSAINRALSEYSEFLEFTHQDKKTIASEYEAGPQKWREKSYQFGESIEQAMSVVGKKDGKSSALYRLMLI